MFSNITLLMAAAACGRFVNSTERILVLFKTFKPTPAMAERICLLFASHQDNNFAGRLYQFAVSDASLSSRAFLDVASQVKECYGFSNSSVFRSKRFLNETYPTAYEHLLKKEYSLSHYEETLFHAHNFQLSYDYLWVLEEDIAWQGKLLDALDVFASWREDFLCSTRTVKRVGDGWGRNWDQIPELGAFHSGWHTNASFVHCYVFMVRYSRSLLDSVHAHLLNGSWAYVEWHVPTLCESHIPGCAVREYGQQAVFGTPFKHFGSISQQDFGQYNVSAPSMLYHKAKF